MLGSISSQPGGGMSMNTKTSQKYCTSKQAAALLMVSPVTIREWARKGLLPAVTTVGGHRRFLMQDLRAFAATRGITLVEDTPEENGGARRVLLVDDDPVFATYLREIIVAADPSTQVEWASDGFEAGERTASFRPQLFVIDLYMPRVDGIELCRRLRANATSAQAELVILSSSLTDETIAAVRSAGADRWIEKHRSRAEILGALGFGASAAANEAADAYC